MIEQSIVRSFRIKSLRADVVDDWFLAKMHVAFSLFHVDLRLVDFLDEQQKLWLKRGK